MKILIAEEDLLLSKIIEVRLKKEGYETVVAVDGRSVMEQIKLQRPDLIICDIVMPYFSGLEIVENVRQKLKLGTPIIILSSLGLEETVLQAFELGANDYVTKPFNPSELLARVRRQSIKSDNKIV